MCFAYQTAGGWRSLPSPGWVWEQTRRDWGCLWEAGEQTARSMWRREDPGCPGWDQRRGREEQPAHPQKGTPEDWDSEQDRHVERGHLEYKVRESEEGRHHYLLARLDSFLTLCSGKFETESSSDKIPRINGKKSQRSPVINHQIQNNSTQGTRMEKAKHIWVDSRRYECYR